MDKSKEWEIEFAKMILITVKKVKEGRYSMANSLLLITKLMEIDRKHQREEMLKRLPSPKELADELCWTVDHCRKMLKAVKTLIKKKLKEE